MDMDIVGINAISGIRSEESSYSSMQVNVTTDQPIEKQQSPTKSSWWQGFSIKGLAKKKPECEGTQTKIGYSIGYKIICISLWA